MKFLLTTLIVFLYVFLPAQPTGWNYPELDDGNNSCTIIQQISFDGVNLSNVNDYVAIRRQSDSVMISLGTLFKIGSSYYINQVIDANDASPGDCFIIQLFIQDLNGGLGDSLYVNMDLQPSDVRLCSSPSSILKTENNVINIGDDYNLRQAEPPTSFGPYQNVPDGDPLVGFGGSGSLFALPVIYSSISLTNKDCKLVSFNWTTESEIDNEGFYVERRAEGKRKWEELDFIAGNGTTNEAINYSFIDTEITKDKSLKVVYYRLKQVDFNGRVEYSDTKSIRLNCGNESYINVFPNPVFENTSLTLSHEDARDNMITFNIYSINGQLISNFTRIMSDKETIDIEVSIFPKGLYRIQAITNNQIIAHTKFVKS